MTTLPGPADALDISFNADALETLRRAFADYGDAFRIFSPATNTHVCVFSHPDHVRHILVENHANYTKGIGIERVRILLGNGIMTSEGDIWRRQRKMIQPAFHRDVISRMTGHIREANNQLRDKWLDCARRSTQINLTQDLSDVTLKIVMHSIFGADMQAFEDTKSGNPFELLTQNTERNLQFAYKFRALSGLVMECINRRRREVPEFDLLGILISGRDRKTNNAMTDRQLIDEILTLIVAGHETTASALNWLWYLVARHPRVELQLQQEIDAWEEDAAAPLAIDRLNYTRQVIEETMRLYPPGWLLTRRSIQGDVIGGHLIDPDTDVFVSPYLVHRHPAFWANPDDFDPSRFATPVKAQRNRFCYLPFALGPRACIGEHFAMTEMIMHTALIAKRLKLRRLCDEPVEMECQVNLRPKQNIFMLPVERH